jgi:thiol:disulfide interchange protein DsbA
MKKLFLFALVLVVPSLVFAQGKVTWDSIEGIEYQRVVPAQQTTAKNGQVEVVELFWYGCPHCYRLEPDLKKWLKNKPANVVFRRIPAQMNPGWKVHARLYYVAEILGVADKLHDAIFHEVQEKNNMLSTENAMAAFFVKHGISKDKFLKVYRSIGLRTRMAHGRGMGQRYGAHSVPTLIVNGKYRTNVTMAGGTHQGLFKVINELISKEMQAQKK